MTYPRAQLPTHSHILTVRFLLVSSIPTCVCITCVGFHFLLCCCKTQLRKAQQQPKSMLASKGAVATIRSSQVQKKTKAALSTAVHTAGEEQLGRRKERGVCMCVCVSVCVCACVCTCVDACVHACVCGCSAISCSHSCHALCTQQQAMQQRSLLLHRPAHPPPNQAVSTAVLLAGKAQRLREPARHWVSCRPRAGKPRSGRRHDESESGSSATRHQSQRQSGHTTDALVRKHLLPMQTESHRLMCACVCVRVFVRLGMPQFGTPNFKSASFCTCPFFLFVLFFRSRPCHITWMEVLGRSHLCDACVLPGLLRTPMSWACCCCSALR